MSLTALNTFAGNPLDRAGDRRDDADWLAEQAASPGAMAMVLWEGRPLIEAGEPRLAWLALSHARAVVPDRELFLGLWKGAPCFAVEVEGAADPAAGPLAGLGAVHDMREAAALWERLTAAGGMDARDAVWAHPDLMPTAADLDEPAGFIDRIIGGDVSSADVDELIAEFQKDNPDGDDSD